ncbi:MAG: PQQ-binding-like beta-propeller repeat protein [Gemmataceae bacterium]|nr:PQQ-binding-like beta-propeller repeat protein [Gemmataceae bacterium]
MKKSIWSLSVAGALFISQAHAESWTSFRGPTGDGHVKGEKLPDSFKPGQELWKQAIPGKGWSTPAVVAGKIFLTTAIPNGEGAMVNQSLEAMCLNVSDGKVVWKTPIFEQKAETAPKIHGKNSHASPSPIWHENKIYVHFGHMGTACLDEQGKILWKVPGLYTKPVHGNGGSPILVDDMLIFSCDGTDAQKVVAIKIKDGSLAWSTDRQASPTKPFSFSTPELIEVNGKKMVISSASDMVGAYDPKTGKEIWRVKYKGYSVIPKPLFANGLVFISTSYDRPVLYAIKPDGKGDVTETHVAWKLEKNIPHTPNLIAEGPDLFMVADNGMASCVEAATGKVHWGPERIDGAYSSSPVISDGKIYFQNEEGKTTVVKAARTFQKIATSDIGERTLASFAVADGKLFVRTEKSLFAFTLKSLASR